MILQATARANSNIALIKYWGKRDEALNLPQNGSISMTLDGLHTTTTVRWDDALPEHKAFLDRKAMEGSELAKIGRFLNRIKQMAGVKGHAMVETHNSFPTAAGLASSASGYAALALAATKAAGLELSERELSLLARQGSGSASRSIFGGFVEWHRGEAPEGSDSYAESLLAPEAWDLRMLVVVLEDRPKAVSSREAMARTVATSPMYPSWLSTVEADLGGMREAIANQDLEAVGTLAEANCLKMHATMHTTLPSVIYWQPSTLALMHRVQHLRREGLPCFFTIDAGPNVKVLCRPEDAAGLSHELHAVPGVRELIACSPGLGASLL